MRISVLGTSAWLLAALPAAAAPDLDAQSSATLTVEETAGIRRTQFPARALVELARGELEVARSIRLTAGDTEVPAQGTAVSTWDDGSVRGLEVDFNVSIGPFETSVFELSYGPDVVGAAAPRRGLSVADEGAAYQVGRVRFNGRGDPLLISVDYRGELIGDGRNGIAVLDDAGVRYSGSEVAWQPARLLKPGPLTVHLRHEGELVLRDGSTVQVVIDAEMPNSKSWVKLAAAVTDPSRRVRGVTIETPLTLGGHPWTWDIGTRNATYGAIRGPTDSVVLTHRIYSEADASWTVHTGPVGEERPYEESAPGAVDFVRGWVHVQSAREAVAFAIGGLGERAGTFTAALTGDGQTAFGFTADQRAARHSLTVYQHYVSTPVPIGAATSPASILSPLRVTVD